MKFLRSSQAALVLSLALAACHGEDPGPEMGSSGPGGKADSLEDFLDGVYCEPDSEVCIVEGDIPLVGRDALLEYFYATEDDSGALTVFRTDGYDLLWDRADRFDLTYCVSKEGFTADQHRQLVDAMAAATAEWEAIAHIDYRHIAAEDERCEIGNPKVRFPVLAAPANAGYIARAFFPYYDELETAVRMSFTELDYLSATYPEATLQGILRHELGHTLGFRHEHIRPENNGWCREDDDFRPITEYDNRSTMHYPFCDGEGDWSLQMTELDAIGAAFFYPNFDQYRGDRCLGEELLADGSVEPGCAPVVHEILELANVGSFEILDEWVGLDRRAADNIVAARASSPFITLDALEDVSYVGPAAVRKLYDYLYVDGRCPVEFDANGLVDIRCRPVVHRVLELANNASIDELDVAAGLDSRAARNIVEYRVERPFTSLLELWQVSYVKARALEQMYDYLY